MSYSVTHVAFTRNSDHVVKESYRLSFLLWLILSILWKLLKESRIKKRWLGSLFCREGWFSRHLERNTVACVKPYSRDITNYLYPAAKRKTGLTALTTAAVSPRVQHHELYMWARLKSFPGARGTPSR